jgi:hypothetical protein
VASEDEELEAELDAANGEESEADRQRRRDKGDLSAEIARRWDPDQLLRLVAGRAGRGERLDEATRQKFERRMGVDLSGVRVYTGEFAEEVTRAHTAEAVTIGNTGMILMSGTPERSMGTTAGEALLAHELTHVAQAQQGMFGKGSDELGNEAEEREAEQAEETEHQEAAGGGQKGESSSAAADEEQAAQREQVVLRVLDMFAAQVRSEIMRGGGSPRRP